MNPTKNFVEELKRKFRTILMENPGETEKLETDIRLTRTNISNLLSKVGDLKTSPEDIK